jgi:hypothetical protein
VPWRRCETRKYKTWLERLAKDKRSSLLARIVSNKEKGFMALSVGLEARDSALSPLQPPRGRGDLHGGRVLKISPAADVCGRAGGQGRKEKVVTLSLLILLPLPLFLLLLPPLTLPLLLRQYPCPYSCPCHGPCPCPYHIP